MAKRSELSRERLVLADRLNDLDFSYKNTLAFARAAGLNSASVYLYLNGDFIPRLDVFCRVCVNLRVSADWLLGLSEYQRRDLDYAMPADLKGLIPKRLEILSMEYRTVADFQRAIREGSCKAYDWIQGRNLPDPESLAVICRERAVSADWMLGFTADPGRRLAFIRKESGDA